MFFTTLTQKEVFEKWIAALRSGAYLQGVGALRMLRGDQPPQYCCVGVLCDLSTEDLQTDWSPRGFAYKDQHGSLDFQEAFIPYELAKWLNISAHHQSELYSRNDDRGASFLDIADYIETIVMPKSLATADMV